MYVYNPDYTRFYGSGPGRIATPPRWTRLNLHRERERENGTNRPTYLHHPRPDHHGRRDGRTDSNTDSRHAAHLPGRERHEGPERIHPRPHKHSRRTEEQKDTERREGPAAHGQQRTRTRIASAPAGQSPPVIRRTKRQRRPPQDEERKRKEKRKSTWTHGKPLFSKRKMLKGVQTPESLLSA